MQQTEEHTEGWTCSRFPQGGECVVGHAGAWEGIRGGSFIVTTATTAIALHFYILIHYPANATVSLRSNHPHNSEHYVQSVMAR
jgi:hypothetical protein